MDNPSFWAPALVLAAVLSVWWIRSALTLNRPDPELHSQFEEQFQTTVEDTEPTVSLADLERDYAQQNASLRNRQEEIEARKSHLSTHLSYEVMPPERVLQLGSRDERAALGQILGSSHPYRSVNLISDLRKAGSHAAGNWIRGGEGVAYEEVVRDVGAKLGAKMPPSPESLRAAELAVLDLAFQMVLQGATPEQRQAIISSIEVQQGSGLTGIGVTTSALVVANLSGFALYSAAATTLGAVTGALGVTLPFATYMGLSSVLAFATGPVGWAALGGWAIYKLGGVDYKKTVPGVILVATVRSRLIAERDQELTELEAEQVALRNKLLKLVPLRNFLDGLKSHGPLHRVRAQDVPK
jgi:uncharacterized protein YaaW (UPF0174 family)